MYEMLHYFKLLPADNPRVSTMHVCEAPGGFIAATNHYLRKPIVALMFMKTNMVISSR